MSTHASLRRVTIALAAALGVPLTHGATWDWNNATAVWSAAGAWTPDTTPISANDTLLRFGGAGGTAYTSTNDLSGPFLLRGLELNSSATVTETIAASVGGSLSFVNDGVTDPLITQNGAGAFDLTLGVEATNALSFGGNGTGLVTFGGIVSGAAPLTFASGNWRLANVGNTFFGGVNINTGAFLELAPAGAAPQSVNIAVGGATILGGGGTVTINGGTLKLTTSGTGSMVFGGGRPFTFGAAGGVLDLRNGNTTNPNAQGGHITGGDLSLIVNSGADTPAVIRFNGGQFGLSNNSRTDGNWVQANNALRFTGFNGTGTLRIELTNGAMLRAGNGSSGQVIGLPTIWRGVVGGDPTSGPLGTVNSGISANTGRIVVDLTDTNYSNLTLQGALQFGATGASRGLRGTIVVAGTESGAPGYVGFTGRGTGTQLSSVIQAPGGNAVGQNPLWLLRDNVGSITIQDGGTVVFDPRSRADTGGTNGNGVALDGQLTIQGGGKLVISQSITNFTPGVAATNANAGDILIYGDITGTGNTDREAVFSIALPEPQAATTIASTIPALLTNTATVASERPYGGLRFDDTRGTANIIVNGSGFGGLRVNGIARPDAQLSSTGAVGGAPMADPVGTDVKVASVLTGPRLSRITGTGGYLTIAPAERTFLFPSGGEWGNAVPVGLKIVDHRTTGTDVSLAALSTFRHNVAIDTGATLQLGDAAPFTFDNNATIHGKGAILSSGSVTVNVGASISPGLNDLGTLAFTTGNLTISGNLRMDLAATSADLLAVTGNLSLGGTLALTGSYGNQDLILASYSGSLTGTFGVITGLSPVFAVDYGTGTNSVIKLVYDTSPSRVWEGAPGATWSVGGGNWKNGELFANGNRARFDGTASGSTSVTITGSNVAPLETSVHTDTKNYTITSSAGAALAGAGPLTKTGEMILTLLGPALYTGGTIVSEGTLALGSDHALPEVGTIAVADGATLDTKGRTDIVGDLVVDGEVIGGGTLAVNALTLTGDAAFEPNLVSNASIRKTDGPGTLAVPIDFNTGVRVIDVAAASTLTLTGTLTNGGFDKTGPGELILAPLSPNLNLGGTGVSGGKLTAQAGAIPADSPITVNTGGSLEILEPLPLSVGPLSGTGGTITAANGLTLNQSATTTFSGGFAGATAVTMAGTGQITLNGASTHTGGIVANAGRLILGSPGAGGAGFVRVNPGSKVASGAALATRVELNGGTFFGVGGPASIASADVVATAGTTTTISLSDPDNANTRSEMRIPGTLKGSGNLNVVISSNSPHPDGGVGFRLIGTGISDYSGTILMAQSTKFELQTTQGGPFSPAGTGKLAFVGGNFTGGLNGDYSQFNIRNNFNGNTVLGNNVEVLGTGFVNMNMAGTPGTAVNAMSTLGELRIGADQILGVNKNGASQVLAFTSVSLTSGDATFAPNTAGFGASGTSDLQLGAISELVPGSGIVMNGQSVLTLAGTNSYTGTTRVENGTLRLGSPGALPGVGALVVNGGTVDLGTGFISFSQSAGSLAGTFGTVTNSDAFSTAELAVNQPTNTTFAGILAGNLALTKTGSGALTLTGASTATGLLSAHGGTLVVNGSVASATDVAASGTLSGTGTLRAIKVGVGGVLSPGTTNLATGLYGGMLSATEVNFVLGSAMDLSLAKATPGGFPNPADYSQLKITETVTLDQPDLDLSLGSGLEQGDIFTIILNDGPLAVTGTFFGRANGDIFSRGGGDFQISYFDDASTPGILELAGGNDVSLLVIPEPASATLLLGGLALLTTRRRRK